MLTLVEFWDCLVSGAILDLDGSTSIGPTALMGEGLERQLVYRKRGTKYF